MSNSCSKAPSRNREVGQQTCRKRILDVISRVHNLFLGRANFKYPKNFAGQSEIVILFISAHKLNLKQRLVTALTKNVMKTFFRILNSFRATDTPNFPSFPFKDLFILRLVFPRSK